VTTWGLDNLVPAFAPIAAWKLLKRRHFTTESSLKVSGRFVCFICFPAMLSTLLSVFSLSAALLM
jgi:hypothetical protein